MRCHAPARRGRALLALLCCLPAAAAPLAVAQQTQPAPVERLRRIPDHALEGVMSPPDGRFVVIDRTRFVLAPGALIRDLNNRIVLPAYVHAPARVRYTLDRNRQVSQIWMVAAGP